MPHAHIAVAQDRSAAMTLDGDTTQHSDLGSALTHIANLTRTAQRQLTVQIEDGAVIRFLTVSASGQIGPAPEAQAEAALISGASGPHAPAQEAPSAAEEAAAGDGPADGDPALPAEQVQPADLWPSYPLHHEQDEAGAAPSREHGSASAPEEGPSDLSPAAPDSAAASTDAEAASAEDFPVGNRYSGPAEPLTPLGRHRGKRRSTQRTRASRKAASRPVTGRKKGKEKDGEKHSSATAEPAPRPSRARSKRPAAAVRISVPGLVLGVLLIAAVAFFFLPGLVGTPTPTQSGSSSDSAAPSRAAVPIAEATSPVPGFSEQPAWEAEVPSTASVTATSRGVLVVDSGELSVLDPTTGEERYSGSYSGSITFAADTVIDGQPALAWRSDDGMVALFDGSETPVEYPLSAEARVSSAGTSVLIREGNTLHTLGLTDLEDVPTPAAGSTPMAVEDGMLVSAPFDGPVSLTDIRTGESTEMELEKPSEGLEIKQWKSAGHGHTITVWGEPESNPATGQRLQLAVHDLEDGSLASVKEASSGDVGAADWNRGQGYDLAVIGPFLYDLRTGLLVMDGTETNLQFQAPRGELVPGSREGSPVILTGAASSSESSAPAAYPTQSDLLAVTQGSRYAIVRTGADLVTAYPTE